MFEKYIRSRVHQSSLKWLMKYYTPKYFYNLFDYVAVWNKWNLEFYTLDENYEGIWEYIRESDDGSRLLEMGYDRSYGCYIVDVWCPNFLEFLMFWNKGYHCSTSEKGWKSMVRENGWSEIEIDEGYAKYKFDRCAWFEREYGKHVSLLR